VFSAICSGTVGITGARSARTPRRRDTVVDQEKAMFWRVLGVIIAVWIAVIVLGAIVKALFPLLALAVVGTAAYFLFRAISGDQDSAKSTF
jgi:hypothetical protein